jgi:site-specific recombinase XerD
MKKDEMQLFKLIRGFLDEYLISMRGFSDKTAKSYRQTLKFLRIYLLTEKGIRFDRMDFTCFSRENIYGFLMWLKNTKSNSPKTLNLRLSAVKSFLKYCREEDIGLTSIYLEVAAIHAFKGEKRPVVGYLTPAQLKHVFSLPDMATRLGRRNRFLMIFAYETGARLQELLDLRLSAVIRGDAGVRVRIHGKGGKIRHVPVFGDALKHLDAYISGFHKYSTADAFLFYTIHGGQKTQMQPGTVDYFLKKYGIAASLADQTFPRGLHCHMFRHSVAMAMYKQGIPISYIRDFLGHASVETTSIYSYSDDETILKALESVDHEEYTGAVAEKSKIWKGNEQQLIDFCGLY